MAAEHAAATLVEAVTGLAVAAAEEAAEEAVVAAVAAAVAAAVSNMACEWHGACQRG